jgi:hypothetical protein
MSARQGQRGNIATAAAARTAPQAKPAGQTAIRTKPVRITIDLEPADYEALNRWIGTAAAQVNSAPGKRVTLAKAVRAMISASILDESIGLVVIDLLRRQTGS